MDIREGDGTAGAFRLEAVAVDIVAAVAVVASSLGEPTFRRNRFIDETWDENIDEPHAAFC